MPCGALASTILVPELEFWVNNSIKASTLNKFKIPIPTAGFCSSFLDKHSFIRLLFDDAWPHDYNFYNYMYKEITSHGSWPSSVVTRLMVYPASAKYYTSDTTDVAIVNLLQIGHEDLDMLNRLLLYRTTDATNVLDIQFTSISSKLAKLIWIYLDLKTRNSYSNYNDSILISGITNVLQSCYESYIIENVFAYISNRGIG